MKTHLFPNFLTDKLEYKICKNYWETKIEYLLQKDKIINPVQYLNTQYVNGLEQLTGNPIVNYFIKSKNKALRIIQTEPETETVEFSAWTNKFQTDDLDTIELVISLELTPEAEQVTFDFIRKWIVSDFSASVMEKYIDYVYENKKSLQTANMT